MADKFVAPDRSQVLLLAHSIAEEGHRGLAQAAEANASLSTTSRTKLLQVLGGVVILVHAFLLPHRAVYVTNHAEERALDSDHLWLYALTLYPLDLLFLCAARPPCRAAAPRAAAPRAGCPGEEQVLERSAPARQQVRAF